MRVYGPDPVVVAEMTTMRDEQDRRGRGASVSGGPGGADEIRRPGVDRKDGAVAVGISSGPDLLSASKESAGFVVRAVVIVVAARPSIRQTP